MPHLIYTISYPKRTQGAPGGNCLLINSNNQSVMKCLKEVFSQPTKYHSTVNN